MSLVGTREGGAVISIELFHESLKTAGVKMRPLSEFKRNFDSLHSELLVFSNDTGDPWRGRAVGSSFELTVVPASGALHNLRASARFAADKQTEAVRALFEEIEYEVCGIFRANCQLRARTTGATSAGASSSSASASVSSPDTTRSEQSFDSDGLAEGMAASAESFAFESLMRRLNLDPDKPGEAACVLQYSVHKQATSLESSHDDSRPFWITSTVPDGEFIESQEKHGLQCHLCDKIVETENFCIVSLSGSNFLGRESGVSMCKKCAEVYRNALLKFSAVVMRADAEGTLGRYRSKDILPPGACRKCESEGPFAPFVYVGNRTPAEMEAWVVAYPKHVEKAARQGAKPNMIFAESKSTAAMYANLGTLTNAEIDDLVAPPVLDENLAGEATEEHNAMVPEQLRILGV